MTEDPYARFRDQARALIVAEIEDVLTRTAPGTPPGEEYAIASRAIALRSKQHVLSVLVEAAAIAGEAVIRLAAERGEDPRATWQWLLTTEWTGSEHAPEAGSEQ